MSEFKFSPAPDAPPPPKSKLEDGSYSEIPWYRESSINTIFILVNVISCGCLPLILVTCAILVTGDIYYKTRTPDGKLKKWGFGNKVIAFGIVGINAIWLMIILTAIVAGLIRQ